MIFLALNIRLMPVLALENLFEESVRIWQYNKLFRVKVSSTHILEWFALSVALFAELNVMRKRQKRMLSDFSSGQYRV